MKHEIEISDDVAPWGDPDEKPCYSCNVTCTCDYRNADNYRTERIISEEIVSAETVEELYEQLGAIEVQIMLRNEECNRLRNGDYKDPYEVRFSDVFVQVAAYNEEKMKASNAYQEVGAAREKKAQEDAERARLEAIRVAKYKEEEKERRDRAEFERLTKKYAK